MSGVIIYIESEKWQNISTKEEAKMEARNQLEISRRLNSIYKKVYLEK